VDFLLGEASVAAEEGVALGIWSQRLADVSDGHKPPVIEGLLYVARGSVRSVKP
jgi:hypothetical protein